MVHPGLFGLVALYTIGSLECTPQVQWTLYTRNKYWNEGQLICWTLGGRLASPDSQDDKTAMDYFINNQPWKSNAGTLTLFLDIGEVMTDDLRWNDCGDVFSVWQKSFDPTSDKCAGVLPSLFSTNQKISSAACYDQKRSFICEAEVSPTCPYEAVVGLPTAGTGKLQSNIHNDSDCQQLCTDDAACRAYVFSPDCIIYTDDDSMLFEGGANIDITETTRVTNYKVCYLSTMVETTPELTSPTSFTPFPFDCNAQDPVATVLTVFSDCVTWAQATSACSSLNASLAVLDPDTNFVVASALMNDASLSHHWVGYQKFNDEPAEWTTGGNVTNVTAADPPVTGPWACGTTDLWTGEHRLYDCDTLMPYVCQHTTGECHYAATHGFSASSGFTDHGDRSMTQCFEECEARRDTGGGAGCYAFVTHFPDLTMSKSCLTLDFNSWEESFTTADSWINEESGMTLWRFTCITVAVDNYTKIELQEESTTVAPTTTTETTVTTTFSSTQTTSSATTTTPQTTSATTSPQTTGSPAYYSTTGSTSMTSTSDGTVGTSTEPNPSTDTTSVGASTPNLSTESTSASTPNPSTESTSASTPNPSTESTSASTTAPSTESTSTLTPNPYTESTSAYSYTESTSASTPNPSTQSSSASTPNPSTQSTSASTPNPSTQSTSASTPNPSTSTQNNSVWTTNSVGGLNLCRCPCTANFTYSDPDEFMDELESLRVPKESTGSAYRKKNSIMDYRPSSYGMGTMACAVLVCTFGIVVSFDVINFFLVPNADIFD